MLRSRFGPVAKRSEKRSPSQPQLPSAPRKHGTAFTYLPFTTLLTYGVKDAACPISAG